MELQTFLRLGDVQAITGLSRSTIYDFMAKDQFPKPVHLGPKAVGWVEAEIAAWQAERIAARECA